MMVDLHQLFVVCCVFWVLYTAKSRRLNLLAFRQVLSGIFNVYLMHALDLKNGLCFFQMLGSNMFVYVWFCLDLGFRVHLHCVFAFVAVEISCDHWWFRLLYFLKSAHSLVKFNCFLLQNACAFMEFIRVLFAVSRNNFNTLICCIIGGDWCSQECIVLIPLWALFHNRWGTLLLKF